MKDRLSQKTVLVTGAGGFLGPKVVGAIARQGWSVRALVGPPGYSANHLPEGTLLLESEITDTARVSDALRGCDLVIHMAGPPGVRDSFVCPAEYSRIHVTGTAVVLEACLRVGIKRLVYVSSAEVYGQPDAKQVSEDHPLQARSPYAAAKIGAECFVESFVAAFDFKAVVLRPFSIYGPGMSDKSLVGTIIDGAISHGSIVVSDPSSVRDYCYVDDVAEAVILAATASLPGFNVFNVGSGVGTSVPTLAEIVSEILCSDFPVHADFSNQRPGNSEILRLVADPRLAGEKLKWKARTPLRDGLELTIRAMRSMVGTEPGQR